MSFITSKRVRAHMMRQLSTCENTIVKLQLAIDDARRHMPEPTIERALLIAECGWRLNAAREHVAEVASVIGELT